MFWFWTGFLVLVALFLTLDLGLFNRGDRVISGREALLWSTFWVGLSLLFSVLVYFMYEYDWLGVGVLQGRNALLELPPSPDVDAALHGGAISVSYNIPGRDAVLKFITGYLLEWSLSLDNIFVIALVFRHFDVPLQYQHRVLFWGIIGALVARGALIVAGVVLIQKFSWTVYVFGGFLIFTAVRMLFSRGSEPDPEQSRLLRWARKLYPVSKTLEGHSFFTRIDGKRAVTPLFLVLLVVEGSDVLFAVDSIPAIFGVTNDAFLIFTSNIFALLGLRSLYFGLADLLDRFYYLQVSLVVILAYVGVKMVLSHHYAVPTPISLAVIAGLLLLAIVASVLRARLAPRAPAAGVQPSSKES